MFVIQLARNNLVEQGTLDISYTNILIKADSNFIDVQGAQTLSAITFYIGKIRLQGMYNCKQTAVF